MTSFQFPAATNAQGNPWPAGIYQVTLADIVDDDQISKFNPDQQRVKVTFRVDKVVRLMPSSPEARTAAKAALTENADLIAWCNKTMSKRATLRGWIEALLGRELGVSEVVSPADALGKSAEALLEAYQGQDGTERVKLTTLTPIAADEEASF
jgi:hypothetical protein